jgi:4'-phosphopantetheinyl transferase
VASSIHQLPPVSLAETLTLAPGIVDLWWWCYEPISDPGSWAAYEGFMSPDERQRHQKFRFESDRRLFLATRVLVRTVLSRYAPVVPGEWRFAVSAHGKPHVGSPSVAPLIHFNLANTAGLVVCAVSAAHDLLGVDAEPVASDQEFSGLANRYFSPWEARELRTLPVCERPRRFTAYWTLKESYIKARGLGLNLPLDQFRFVIGDNQASILFHSPELGNCANWRFALVDAPPRYMIAVGVDTGGASLSLRAMHTAPIP